MTVRTYSEDNDTVRVIELAPATAGGLNVINDATLTAISQHCRKADADSAVRVIVLCAQGKHFAVGADVRELSAKNKQQLQNDKRRDNWQAIAAISKPIIAAVQGSALGAGNELVMLCDLVFCDEQAQFGQPEIKLGLIPGAGGTQRLPRIAGKARAMQMALTGKALSATDAKQCGMVCAVCKTELLLETAVAEAKKIAALSPLAVRAAKQCILATQNTSLADGLALEYQHFSDLAESKDRAEGIRAFLEKRAPRFTGK
ncbi:MAG: enoyl-CoA hydratase/isomerase family protein [Proteobacteria bacterium]|nr:enoyl-CoA hydratase/isomerase family protein [Pseudomonadota bacterium]MCH9757742.1 enoyl-CoA hydratase/isomerase family protein [Pseudomonadota bacterium]